MGKPLNAIEAKTRLYGMLRRLPPQAVLLVTFASFYFAIGPGNFFAVDEVMEQALLLRRTIDIPAMVDARWGREHTFYTVKGPGLPLVTSVRISRAQTRQRDWIDERGPACGSPDRAGGAAAALERTAGNLGRADCQRDCGRRDRLCPVHGRHATFAESARRVVDGDSGGARDAGHVGGDPLLSARVGRADGDPGVLVLFSGKPR